MFDLPVYEYITDLVLFYVLPTTSSFSPVLSDGVHNPQYPPHLPRIISPLYNR